MQSSLADILGYDDLDLVGDLILHRESIVKSPATDIKPAIKGADLGDDFILRLMTKEQREEALRVQDLEHKSRPLGPKFAEPTLNYPHIYRAHEAGNTLSAAGKKYSLPLGSQEKQYEVSLLANFPILRHVLMSFPVVEICRDYHTCHKSWGQKTGR